MPIDLIYKQLPFLEAIEFMREKVNIPTATWREVIGRENDWAFKVAGATKADLLQDFRGSVQKAIEEGTTLREFRSGFDKIVDNHGWDYRGGRDWRSRLIYEQNLRSAHQAGRYRQIQQVKDRRPYILYRHGGSLNPREQHLQWDGLVLPADDPFWDSHFPPNGWGCSCSAFTLSDRDLERRGLSVSDSPDIETYEWTNPDTGETFQVPRGIDPGFDHAPGADTEAQRDDTMRGMMARLDPELREKAQSAIDEGR